MEVLSRRVGPENLFGVDLIRPEKEPAWTFAPELDSLPCRVLEDADFFFGVVGASLCTPEWIEQLILRTRRRHLFFASGSTKTVEFSDLTQWLLQILRSPWKLANGQVPGIEIMEIHDPKTGNHQGRTACLKIGQRTVYLHLLADLMPINFLYYGVPSETMNQVMRELLEMSSLLVRRHREKSPLPARLLALDHEVQKTW